MAPLADHSLSKDLQEIAKPLQLGGELSAIQSPDVEVLSDEIPVFKIIDYIRKRSEEVIALIGEPHYNDLMQSADRFRKYSAEGAEYPDEVVQDIRAVVIAQIKSVLGLIIATEKAKSFEVRAQRLKEVNGVLEEKVQKDPLTGLHNREGLTLKGSSVFDLCKEKGYPLSCLFLDIDFFKHVNDTYGHDAGDTVLQTFAELLTREFRGHDVIARPGGEEFVVLCPYTDLEEVAAAAERVRKRIETTPFPVTAINGGGKPRQILLDLTCTIGAAQADFSTNSGYGDIQTLADEAMNQGKSQHRNIVSTIQPQGEEPPLFKYPYLNDPTRRKVEAKGRHIH
jgi:diguanylate cyclase (GGDEF)-like protein